MTLSNHSKYVFLAKAFAYLLSPTSKKAFVELMVGRKVRHTCFKYFAKPKVELPKE